MVDFISSLIMVDPVCRLSSDEALEHPWLRAEPYQNVECMEKLLLKGFASTSLLTQRRETNQDQVPRNET